MLVFHQPDAVLDGLSDIPGKTNAGTASFAA